MAVVDIKSNLLTNLDRTISPRKGSSSEIYGRVRAAAVSLELTNGDSATSTYRFFRLPGNATILSLRSLTDGIDGADSVSFGIFDTPEWGSAVRDADLFGSAIDLSSPNTTGVERRFSNATDGGLETVGEKLYELLGLNTTALLNAQGRPEDFDLVMTTANNITETGSVTLICEYVVD